VGTGQVSQGVGARDNTTIAALNMPRDASFEQCKAAKPLPTQNRKDAYCLARWVFLAKVDSTTEAIFHLYMAAQYL